MTCHPALMSHLRRVAVLAVAALVLSGCSAAATPQPDATTTAPAAPEPDPGPAPGTTSLAPGLMLSAAAFGSDGAEPFVTEPFDTWALPGPCAAGPPVGAVASRGVAYGVGSSTSPLATQQLAVFADASAAVTEAKRLTDIMRACAAAPGEVTFVVEDVAVGAQGTGLVVDYGASAGASGDDALGYYLVTTRRGNAVTLVGHLGGEASIGTSRENAVTAGQAAWRLLCVYDSAGC